MLNQMKNRIAEIGETLMETAWEERILACAGCGEWDKVLILLREMDRPIQPDAAELCLAYALQTATEEMFRKLMYLLPEGDYAGKAILRDVIPEHDVEVEGSLVMLAAAQGRAAQLTCLLDAGCDVNSATPDAAERLMRASRNMDPMQRSATERYEPYSARYESVLRLRPKMETFGFHMMHQVYSGATPLAAALLCGQTECARILMERGAWREEAPSVARVLTMRGREADMAFQSCREAVLTYGDGPRPLALWAVVRQIPEEDLELELRRCPYSEKAIIDAVWELAGNYRMMPHRGIWEVERLRDLRRAQALERHYPRVLRRPELVSLLIRQMLIEGSRNGWCGEWEDFVLSLCGEEVDLSLVREGFSMAQASKLRGFLLRLFEGRRCVMDRDSLPPSMSVAVLRLLIKQVEFRAPLSDLGVSSLSYAVLNTGNLALIRKALQTGIIPAEEPTALLLECAGEIQASTAVRTLLLTVPRVSHACPGAWAEPRKAFWYGPIFRWQSDLTHSKRYGALLEDNCPENLEKELIACGLYDYRMNFRQETTVGDWAVADPLSLLCLTGKDRVVERWVRSGPRDLLRKAHSIRWAEEPYTLMATPLCAAAFAGQAKVAETLLALGAEVNEQQMGVPGMLSMEEEMLPVTPLMAAIARGHWDVARLLMDHGAVCDLHSPAMEKLWSLFQTEDLYHGVQVGLLGNSLGQKVAASLTA